jgi:hypothetical protein
MNSLDVFEDENDENIPGPGAYYNPDQACFKFHKIPEKL